MDSFKKRIIERLGTELDADASMLEKPPSPGMGDFALPCFPFSGKLRKPPAEIAAMIKASFLPDDYVLRAENNGPYVNFFINKTILAKTVLERIFSEKDDYGRKKPQKRKKTVMVEFSSPNTNKPLHLGHLRNIALGESVSRLLSGQGRKVIRSCLVNDRGVHICKSMLMYSRFGRSGEPDKKPDHFVGDYYVMFDRMRKEQPELDAQAQELLQRWESGDSEVMGLWKKMNTWALKGFQETYDELSIRFDYVYYESEIFDKGREIVLEGRKDGRLEDRDGAVIAPLETHGLPDKVLLRKDGTSVYMTQDIYLAKRKFDDFGLDLSVYVVGSEQDLHFRQLFKILEILGFPFFRDCHHLSYGMVYLPSGKMKSREGTVVDADDIISECRGLALAAIKERHRDIPAKEATQRARMIGHGALRFFLLRTDPQRDMVFNPEESISFEGETGPYVQYTHARISSILTRHSRPADPPADYSIYSDAELLLAKQLSDFEAVLEASAESFRPSVLCRFLLDICQAFNEYYHKTPVLKAGKEVRDARLFLVTCIRQVIRNGLAHLGIDAPDRM